MKDDCFFSSFRHGNSENIVETEGSEAFLTITTEDGESASYTFDADECRFFADMFTQAARMLDAYTAKQMETEE